MREFSAAETLRNKRSNKHEEEESRDAFSSHLKSRERKAGESVHTYMMIAMIKCDGYKGKSLKKRKKILVLFTHKC